ncbi:fimbrial biogenesis chaperone [Vibrio sp. LaRot3]|uniref:fimbrial biogenesis chaperone n=1 Tax=Vibrio sp. LaRot3 TaxID=2998829 RepID=UPI0022CDE984|nr:fimbria/pilus periplasmic chaperone [Vibrio sp. LaRot3]MDA0148230.1 molecular chaperone [Vibrio sp. LaRot3]
MKLLILIFCVLFSTQSLAQLLIAPTRLVLDGSNTTTQKVVVENTGDEPVRLEISTTYKKVVGDGVYRHDDNIAALENIQDSIRISPPVIRSLKPGQRRTIRVRVDAIDTNQPDGEYRAYLRFSPTPTTESAPKTSQENTTSIDITFKISTFIPVYVSKGQPAQNFTLQCHEGNFSIVNNSAFQLDTWLKLSDESEPKKLILLRESTMTRPLTKNQKVVLTQDDQEIANCS